MSSFVQFQTGRWALRQLGLIVAPLFAQASALAQDSLAACPLPLSLRESKQKHPKFGMFLFTARAVGIEPTLEVLETPVLPLYDARIVFLNSLYSTNSFLSWQEIIPPPLTPAQFYLLKTPSPKVIPENDWDFLEAWG